MSEWRASRFDTSTDPSIDRPLNNAPRPLSVLGEGIRSDVIWSAAAFGMRLARLGTKGHGSISLRNLLRGPYELVVISS